MSFQQFWDQYIFAPKERYRLSGTLIGHVAPINCMVFLQGEILASGGDDQIVRIWDLKTQKTIQTFEDSRNRWGQVTSMTVSDTAIMGGTMLCCGTGRGQVLIFRHFKKKNEFQKVTTPQVFDGDNVESIAYDQASQRLACTSHNGKLRVNRLERNGNLVTLWTANIEGRIPRTVTFADRGRLVTVYCLESGEIFTRDCETAEKKSSRALQSPIGNLDVCPQEKNIVVDNLTSGYELYSMDGTSPTRSFEIPNERLYVKMVKFAENGAVIIGGSDHGCVYVFNINNSEPAQVLYHERADSMIQTVATISSTEENIIASGSSDGRFDICIWRKPSKRAAARPGGVWRYVLEVMVFVLLVALFYLGWARGFPTLINGLQSVPQMIQERVKSPQVSFGRVRVEEYKSAIAHPLAYSKDRENGVDVRSPQASFPSAEVNEIGRVWMEEEDNAAIGQPVVLEAIV